MSPGGVLGKVRTLGWFLVRPRFYAEFFRVLRFRFFPHPEEDTRHQATEWCRGRAISTEEALAALVGPGAWGPLSELERTRYQQALKVADAVPVVMGGPGNLDLLYHLALRDGVKKAVETGVAFGWSSLAILLGLRSDGQLISTDMPYVRGGNDDFVGCVVPEDIRGRWTLIRLADRQALPRALDALGTIDLCHYDSDKTYVGRIWAYGLLWEALEPGGFFVSDDIGDNDAFRVFADSVAANPIVVRQGRYDTEEKYVGVLRKRLD